MTTTILEPTTVTDEYAHIEYVDPCPGKKGDDVVWEPCWKCGGTGYIHGFEHVENGRCFACYSSSRLGLMERKVRNIRASEKRRVTEHNKAMDAMREAAENAERIAAETAAKREAYRNANPDVALAVDTLAGDFGDSLRADLERYGSLTEKQAWAALDALAKQNQRAAQTWIGVEGEKVTFDGVIEDMKVFEGYAYGTSSYMWIIRTTDGNKVTVFSSSQKMFDARDKGGVYTFTATVKAQKEYQGAKETQVARIKVVK